MSILTQACRRLIHRPSPTCWRPIGAFPAIRFNHTHAVPKPNLTEVEKIIHGNIKATGPLSFATYMQLCLSHPTHGYYMNSSNKVFGSGGDFITSPEISQLFGEFMGIWLLSQWMTYGKGHPIRVVELGPGRGTLMDDILRVLTRLSSSNGEVNVHLVETSPSMRSTQEAKLRSSNHPNVTLHWHNFLDEIKPSATEYTMLVAHEFFDVLPFHVIQKQRDGWHEVLIATTPEETSEAGDAPQEPSPTLRRVLAKQPSAVSAVLAHSSPRFQNLPEGSTLEVSPAAYKIAHKIGQLLCTETKTSDDIQPLGGCGLIVDYGGEKAYSDSFRAFKDHHIVDVFHEPGNCDLTSNVDFAYLKEAMGGLVDTYGPLSQGNFLQRMGINLRLQRFLKDLPTPEKRVQFQDAAARLVDPLGMGSQYQVLGITQKSPEAKQVWPFMEEGDLANGATT